MLCAMDDLGAPIAYLALEEGTPVYASGGECVGSVEHVLAAEDEDIFDGLVIDTATGPGGLKFVDAPEVGDLHERGVVLKVDAAAVEALPEPSENPATVEHAEPEDSELSAKLRRAWDFISGRYSASSARRKPVGAGSGSSGLDGNPGGGTGSL